MGAELPYYNDHHDHDHDGANNNYDGAHHDQLVNDYNDISSVDQHDDHHIPLKTSMRRFWRRSHSLVRTT